jgi:hypothetical protein
MGQKALWTDLRLPANFPGRTGSTQDAFFADPTIGRASPAPARATRAPATADFLAGASASANHEHLGAVFAGMAGPLRTALKILPSAPSGNADAVPALIVLPSTSADFTLDASLLDLGAWPGGLKRTWNRRAGMLYSDAE